MCYSFPYVCVWVSRNFECFPCGLLNVTKQQLREDLENGISLGAPDGILFNGLGPFRYNDSLVPAGIPFETIHVDPGKLSNQLQVYYGLRPTNTGSFLCVLLNSLNINVLVFFGKFSHNRLNQITLLISWPAQAQPSISILNQLLFYRARSFFLTS